MLYKGKRQGYYLYELTDTDLIWDDCDCEHYQSGNVLLFAHKKNIALGCELVKADDLTTALDYLAGTVMYKEQPIESSSDTQLLQALASSEAKSQELNSLLNDLTKDFNSQRMSNQVLIAQLESLQEQLKIERLSRNEVLEDLEVASAETYRKDRELKAAIDAKTQLEQVLATQICELLELDSANADLQKRLEDRGATQTDTRKVSSAASSQTAPGEKPQAETLLTPNKTKGKKASNPEHHDIQILTSPTGKQLYISHEFPLAKGRVGRRGMGAVSSLLRTILFIVLALLIFLAASVVATAQLNDLSMGEALDITLGTLFT